MPTKHRPEVPLTGDVDVETFARRLSERHVVKGIFLEKGRLELGAAFEAVEPTLTVKPRLGRYLPFQDYPLTDQMRINVALARRRHPGLGTREGLRRLSRGDIEEFAKSMVGRLMVAVVADPRTALLRTPEAYATVVGGITVRAARDDEDVVLEFGTCPGPPEYQLGQLEGIVDFFGGRGEIELESLTDDRHRFRVHLLRP